MRLFMKGILFVISTGMIVPVFAETTGPQTFSVKDKDIDMSAWTQQQPKMKSDFIKAIGGFPQKTDLKSQVISRVDKGKYIQEEIIYYSEPGQKVGAYILLPKNSNEPLPAVFCHHQAGQYQITRYGVNSTGFEKGKSEVAGLRGDKNQAYAKELAERGYITFTIDAFGYEEKPIDEQFELTRLILYGKSLQGRLLWDIIRGIDYLMTRPEVDKEKIGMMGHSLGGQQTLFAMAVDERIKVGVASCGLCTYKGLIHHRIISNLPIYVPGILKYMDIEEILCLVAPRPFLILAGSRDKNFPIGGVKKIYNVACKVYSLYSAVSSLGLSIYENEGQLTPKMRDESYAWLDKHLR